MPKAQVSAQFEDDCLLQCLVEGKKTYSISPLDLKTASCFLIEEHIDQLLDAVIENKDIPK